MNKRESAAETTPECLRERVDWYYRERVEKSWSGGHIMRGRSPGPGDVRLMSNDYLAITGHGKIVAAQKAALDGEDATVVMSSVFLQADSQQARTERRLAGLVGTEDALLCQSGYAANTGLLQSILAPDTNVYLDRMAHMSLWEGVKSAGAAPRPFRHNSARHLAQIIEANGPGVVIVDSIYSTDGSVAPLRAIAEVAEAAGCALVVDESHSLGTHGRGGQGMVAQLGLGAKVHFVTVSLAKAFAGRAGLIACSAPLKEFIQYTSHPAIFSSALLPHDLAGLDAALDVIRAGDERRARLHRNAKRLRDGLAAAGWDVSASASQIVPLVAGTEPEAIRLRDALESRGVFGSVFCAPATPRKKAMIRLSVSAAHRPDEIERVIEACAEVRQPLGLSGQAWPGTGAVDVRPARQ